MNLFSWFQRRGEDPAAAKLYQAALDQSRRPWFYREGGVPDTLDGRFEVVAAHVCVLIALFNREKKPEMGQALFDAMFRHMEADLREQGIDMSVRKYIGCMMQAMNGRMQAYADALNRGDEDAFSSAVRRNVYKGEAGDDQTALLSGYIKEFYRNYAEGGVEKLAQGIVRFPAEEKVKHG
jgi:cytochrome b pre-mRNA-processing protein 3